MDLSIRLVLSFLFFVVLLILMYYEHKKRRKLEVRFKDVIDIDIEKEKTQKELKKIEKEKEKLKKEIEDYKKNIKEEKIRTLEVLEKKREIQKEIDLLEEDQELQEFSFYKPKFFYENSEEYKQKIEDINFQMKIMIKSKTAAICFSQWSVDGSKKAGKTMTNQFLKMMIRAFNGESDACIAKVKFNNVNIMEKRIKKAYEIINRLNSSHNATISSEYLDLKLKELYLNYEMAKKLQEEKEEQRAIKELIREEEKAQRDFEREILRAEKEEEMAKKSLESAIQKLKNTHGIELEKLNKKIEYLTSQLEEALQNKERAMSMAQQTKSGHVYVISNIGSFGENVYKIGMTRRLEPLDRVRELGNASVPFNFDVHAMIFSKNAPELENILHKEFYEYRVNKVNDRREFFRVGLDRIEEVAKKYNSDILFTKLAKAQQYRETLMIEKEEREKILKEKNKKEEERLEEEEIKNI